MNDSNATGWTTLVDVPTLAAHLHDPGLRLVDARFTASALAPGGDPDAGLKAWRASHLPGAVHAHLNRDLSDLSVAGHGRHPLPDPEAFARWLGGQGIGPDTQVVVYDAADGAMANVIGRSSGGPSTSKSASARTPAGTSAHAAASRASISATAS